MDSCVATTFDIVADAAALEGMDAVFTKKVAMADAWVQKTAGKHKQ